MAMDTRRLHELAGKHACEGFTDALSEHSRRLASNAIFTSDSGQLKLAGFDDDCDWSDDPSPNTTASTLSGSWISGASAHIYSESGDRNGISIAVSKIHIRGPEEDDS